jgi:hypothetical protein
MWDTPQTLKKIKIDFDGSMKSLTRFSKHDDDSKMLQLLTQPFYFCRGVRFLLEI